MLSRLYQRYCGTWSVARGPADSFLACVASLRLIKVGAGDKMRMTYPAAEKGTARSAPDDDPKLDVSSGAAASGASWVIGNLCVVGATPASPIAHGAADSVGEVDRAQQRRRITRASGNLSRRRGRRPRRDGGL